jgi:hypothetical protein
MERVSNLLERQKMKEAMLKQAQLPFNQREIPFTEEDVFRLGGTF